MGDRRFIFDNVAFQNGANTAYQFTVDYQNANGTPYQFRSQTERIQALMGKKGQQETYLPNLYCRFYNITPAGQIPSQFGPGNAGWGAEIGTPGAYSVNFSNSFPGTTQVQNVGVIAKGYVYTPEATTLRVQTISDDGIAVYLNGIPILQNWTQHGSTTDESKQYPLLRGYTPIEVRYFNNAVDGVCRLFTNIGEPNPRYYPNIGQTGFNQNSGVLYNSAASRQC